MLKLWRYPLKVWISMIILAPFLLLTLSTQPNLADYVLSKGFFEIYYVTLVISSLITFPFHLFLWWIYSRLVRMVLNQYLLKGILLAISLAFIVFVLLALSLPSMHNFFGKANLKFMSAYAIPMTICVFVYKVDRGKFPSKKALSKTAPHSIS